VLAYRPPRENALREETEEATRPGAFISLEELAPFFIYRLAPACHEALHARLALASSLLLCARAARTSAEGLTLSPSRYFIDCGRSPTVETNENTM